MTFAACAACDAYALVGDSSKCHECDPSAPHCTIVAIVSIRGAAGSRWQYAARIEVADRSSVKDTVHLSFDAVRDGGPASVSIVSMEGEDVDLLIAALTAWRKDRRR
jgi:hypothetical protein